MRVKCVRQVDRCDKEFLTIGKIYKAEINPEWYDFYVEDDELLAQGDGKMGNGCSRLSFEWVDGTPEEKALWDYCEEHGIDGL